MAVLLTEQDVVHGFHELLRDALVQATAEHLLDSTSAQDALLGVQLALFYAAIKANGASTLQVGPEVLLSVSSCPSAFTGILTRWIEIATDLARLCPDARHDVGRCVVDLEMLSSPVAAAIPLIVKNLREVALEISQRVDFEDRYAADLVEAAAATASFTHPLPRDPVQSPPTPPPPRYKTIDSDAPSEMPSTSPPLDPASFTNLPRAESPPVDHLWLIRETLYAAFADVLVATPALADALRDGRSPQTAFIVTTLAILDVALFRMTPDGAVRSADYDQARDISLSDTPLYLQDFITLLARISHSARALSEGDNAWLIEAIARGSEGAYRVTGIERVRAKLLEGTIGSSGYNPEGQEPELIELVTAVVELATRTSLAVEVERALTDGTIQA